MRAAQHPRPQPDPLAPGQRVQPDVARNHRHVEVVAPLGADVHVAAEYLHQLVLGRDCRKKAIVTLCRPDIKAFNHLFNI